MKDTDERNVQIEYALHAEHPISARHLRLLYAQEGWWPERSEDDIIHVLDTGPAIGAWDNEQLVGFARAVSDGRFRAYIEDVIVDRDYRQAGVGAQLVDQLLAKLRATDAVSLFCAPALVKFYTSRGFYPTQQVVLHHRLEQGE